jgi:hypothetical protein
MANAQASSTRNSTCIAWTRLKKGRMSLTRYSVPEFIERAGAQGIEFLNWMAMRGALTGRVQETHRNYHIPISNTAAATLVLKNEPAQTKRRAVERSASMVA